MQTILSSLWTGVRRRARASVHRMGTRHFWFATLPYRTLLLANVACASHLVGLHVLSISIVEGPSMLPTMDESGEMVLELKMINLKHLQRGDLITFASPLDPTRKVCKRIMGLPGDVVCVDPTGTYAPSTEHVVIPRNHVWVTGDNLDASRDSRMYGPIPMGLIHGKLYGKVWPLQKLSKFKTTFEYLPIA